MIHQQVQLRTNQIQVTDRVVSQLLIHQMLAVTLVHLMTTFLLHMAVIGIDLMVYYRNLAIIYFLYWQVYLLHGLLVTGSQTT